MLGCFLWARLAQHLWQTGVHVWFQPPFFRWDGWFIEAIACRAPPKKLYGILAPLTPLCGMTFKNVCFLVRRFVLQSGHWPILAAPNMG